MKNWLTKQSFRIFGQPPSQHAPEVERLRYIRRIYAQLAPLYVLAVIIAATSGFPTWAWIVIAFGAAAWLQGLISLMVRIRRTRAS